MAESFQCPSCHAPLAYEEGKSVVTCAYCGNNAIVPETLRPKQRPSSRPVAVATSVVVIPQSGESKSGGGCVALLVLGVVLSVLGVGIFAWWSVSRVASEFPDLDIQPVAVQVTVVPTPGIARELLTFGSQGTAQGQLDDAREIGVDGAGNVYVADYISGRVQRFNAAGEYQGQWSPDSVDDLHAITNMVVARDGTILLNLASAIHRFEGLTGAHLGEVTLPDQSSTVLEGAAFLPDGGLVLIEWGHELVWLDAAGNLVRRVEVPERERGSSFDRLAVDGQGNVFVLGRLGQRGRLDEGVFRFDASGQYLNFIGGGQITAANAVAVDGHERVFVSASVYGIHVFNTQGQSLGIMQVPLSPFGIAVDGEGHLWVTNREQVFEYEVVE